MNRNVMYRKQQSGTALLVGLLLLVIVTLMTVFAVNIGVFEQRASSNEYRHKQSFHASEAGIGAAIEFIKLNQDSVIGDAADNWFDGGQWATCVGGETEPDPCAYMSDDIADLGGTVYKYVNAGTNNFLDLPAVMNPSTGTTFQVKALLCIFDTTADTCLHQVNRDDTEDFAIQLISFGASDDAIGSSTVSTIVAPFPVILAEVASPVTANSFSASGTFDLVTNPNGGGNGVPVSVWTPNAFGASGSATTCQRDEWMHTYNPDPPVIDPYNENTTVVYCDDCVCPKISATTDDMEWLPLTDGTYVDSGDIVANDPAFPDDLFKYLFGVPESQWPQVKARAQKKVTDCTSLDATTGGFYWVTGPCKINNDVGTPGNPIFLVAACGDFEAQGGDTIFGLIYIHQLESCTGSSKIAGGTQIYGAVLADGEIQFGSGSSQIIYDAEVLRNIGADRAWGPIPGTWRDYL